MNLQIRDSRAHRIARQLAARRSVSMTEAVVSALEAELARIDQPQPLIERITALQDRLARIAGSDGRDMNRDDFDAMWGHEPDDRVRPGV